MHDQRAAGDLRHSAAAHQRLGPVERFQTGVGIVVAAEQRQPGRGPPARAEQHVEKFILVLRKDSRRPGQRDFDRTAAQLAEHAGVGLEFVAAGVAASERAALVADMLRQDGGGEAHRAGADRFAQQRRDLPGLGWRRRTFHRLLTHHEVAKRSQRGQETKIDAGAAARGRVHELREGLPVPGDPFAQDIERNRLDVDEVPRRDLAHRGPARRDSHAAVAHHD